jgi:hypothetical protein
MKTSLFILGSTRSGTSAIRNALALTRYNGAGEGHTLGLLGVLFDTVETYFHDHQAALSDGTMLAEWRRDEFWNEVVLAYLAQIRRVFPDAYYLDKTPTIVPIQYLDVIESSMPAPFFIFCRRRGIDNVLSKTKKWPQTPFAIHCEEWRDVLDLWDERKQHLSSPWIEIEFDRLRVDPEKAAKQIGAFLSLSAPEVSQVGSSLAEGQDPTPKDGAVSIDDVGWTDDQKKLFLDICGSTMERCGYGYYSYWRTAPDVEPR